MTDKFWNAVKEAIELEGFENAEVTPESSIEDDLGMDSLDLVTMVMTLEEELDIVIPDEDAYKWKTAGDVADYLRARA